MKSRMINILFAVAAVAIIVYYIALGMAVRFGQSMMWVWPLAAFVLLARHVYVARFAEAYPLPHALTIALRAFVLAALVFFFIVEGIIFKAGLQTAPGGLDYIIVLGAKVNGTTPGGALRNRIQVAYEYASENPDTVIIASGGQGSDEGISEAACIYENLVKKGIDPSRIIVEDKSTSTQENIDNSLSLISYGAETRIGIVTNDFHLYRSLRLAAKTDVKNWYGIRVATSLISWPHYMMREFAAVVVETLQRAI